MKRKIKAPPPPDPCPYRVGAERRLIRRVRKDGTTYSVPIVVGGTPCGAPAVVTRFRNGSAIRRCIPHLNAP